MVKSDIKVGEEYAASLSGFGRHEEEHPARVKVLELDHEREVEIVSRFSGNRTGRYKTERCILVEVIADRYGRKPKKADRNRYIKDGRYFFTTWAAHEDYQRRMVEHREEQDAERERQYAAYRRIKPMLKKIPDYYVPDYDTASLKFTPILIEELIKAVKKDA